MLWLKIIKMWFGVHILTNIFFIVILVSTTMEENCAETRTSGITYPRGDINIKEGNNLTIYCTLNKESMESPNYTNSSWLEFTVGEESLPSEMFDIVNSSTIRLHIENVTESFKVYSCKIKVTNQMVCLNNVYVATPPKPVLNFSCVSLNWENIKCTWHQPKNFIKTDYYLFYQLPGRASRGVNFNCHENKSEHIEDNLHQCVWNVSTIPQFRRGFEKMNFTMVGNNSYGTISTVYNFKTFESILINAPYNLTVISKTSNSIYISCEMQGSIIHFPKGLKYRIQYQSQYNYDKNLWETLEVEEKNKPLYEFFKYNLTNLKYPHTLYDIRVRVASLVATSESLWSKFSSITVRTESTIPSYSPKVDLGSFEVLPVIEGRDVYIYWQQIPDYHQNGEDFTYSIDVKENNKLNATIKPNETTTAYAKFTGLRSGRYVFDVYSANKEGRSISPSVVVVPSVSDSVAEPTSFTKIAFDNHTYELSWKEPQHANKKITSYTIFWCRFDKDRPYQCEGYLDWERVSPETRMLNKTVDSNSIYQFAISANTETASSGMVWASCTIIYNRFVSKIKHVWVNKISSTFIEMGWKLDCSDRIGIITGFRIYYCPIISPINLNCNDSVLHNITVIGDLNTMTGNVTNLRPYTTYMLHVSVLTMFGEGLMSDSKYNTTYEAAPDAIENVEIIGYTNTTISLKWDRPKNLNGMFLYYKIKYNNEEQKIDDINILNCTLQNLTSFTTYNISVTGCTIECSNASDVKSVTTKIGYPTVMDEPKINYMNVSQLKLYWSRPVYPGGNNLYQVRIIISGENREEKYITSDLHIELPIPSCENNYSEHIYSVRAINKAEDNTELEGPWSPSKKFPCSYPKARYTILYTVIGLAAFVFIVAFIIIGKKGWIRYQEMKNVQVTLPPGLTHTIGDKESDYVLTQRPVLSTGLQTSGVKPIKEILPNETLNSIASDEQLLLEKKKSTNFGELDSTLISGESSGCSSGNESISSSIASVPISNIACNVSDSGTEHALSADTASLESGSLRWRNVANKPHSSELTSNVRTESASRLPTSGGQSVWTKPYVTMPSQDKIDHFSGAWTKPTIGSSGYCQVGMDPIPATTQSSQPITPGYVQVPMLGSSDSKSKSASDSKPYVPHSKKPIDKLMLTKPAFSSVQVLDDENASISQSDSDSSVNESPNIQASSFKYSPIVGTPMKVCDLISIRQGEIDETDKELCKPENLYTDHSSCVSPYVKIGTDDTENKSNVTPYVKVGCEEIKSVLPSYPKSTDIGVSKKNTSPSSYVTLPQAIARQASQKSQSSAADARPLLPSPPAAYSRIGILEPSTTSNSQTRSLPEYVQWKNSDSISESAAVKYDADKLVPEKSAKSKTAYGVHRQFDCKLLKED